MKVQTLSVREFKMLLVDAAELRDKQFPDLQRVSDFEWAILELGEGSYRVGTFIGCPVTQVRRNLGKMDEFLEQSVVRLAFAFDDLARERYGNVERIDVKRTWVDKLLGY